MNYFKLSFLTIICAVILSAGGVVFAYQNPVSNAGPDVYLTSGQTVTLQGSGYDPNGYPISNTWTCSGGTLSNYNILKPVYTAPSNSSNNQTSYICTLTIANSLGGSTSDNTTIYLNYINNPFAIQTNYATYVSNFQATLNGTVSNQNSYTTNEVYFQWGLTTNYGNITSKQTVTSVSSFEQGIESLTPGTLYHYRAVAQGNYGTVYGQDMTFTTSGAGSGNANNSFLSVTKQVINLSSGNLNWSSNANASPYDVLNFKIILQANNQDVHNIVVKDALPSTLVYNGKLSVNANYTGDITSGLNISSIPAGQTVVISYQAQVSSGVAFGATTISNNAVITSTEAGTETASASISVNKSLVYGASDVATGLTNYLFTDSFILPLILLLLGIWFYFSGEIYVWADKLKTVIKK